MDWKSIPSLAALRAFEAAARHQSFSKAAQELNVTHAAIAQHVRNLEAEFSERLIVKQGRGIATTRMGSELATKLRHGFGVIQNAITELRADTRDRALHISATPAFASHWLMPRIGEFWSLYPDIQISITTSTDQVDLRAEGYDLALRYGTGSWSKLDAELLTDGDYCVVVKSQLIKGRNISGLQDLYDFTWLFEPYLLERRQLFEDGGLALDQINVELLHTNTLLLSATLAGLGVAIIPKTLVKREISEGILHLVHEFRTKNLGYHIVTVPNHHPNGLREFIAWLRKHRSPSLRVDV